MKLTTIATALVLLVSGSSSALANSNAENPPLSCYDKHNDVTLRPGSTYTMETSWYGSRIHQGHPMANGEPFDRDELTLAHKVVPLGSVFRVRNPETGVERIVEVTDDGPHPRGRDLDASRALAEELGIIQAGHRPLIVTILRFGNDECRDDGKGLR